MKQQGGTSILLAAATELELRPVLDFLANYEQMSGTRYRVGKAEVTVLITGAGMLPTGFELQRALQTAPTPYDLVLHLGVAGSYDRTIELATVLEITTETIGDLGIEERDGSFTPLHRQPWHRETPPFEEGVLRNSERYFPNLPTAHGRTLNRVSGSEKSLAQLPSLPHTVESMEGAAVFYTCLRMKQAFVSLRAVSNYVEPRDQAKWRMQEAVEGLGVVCCGHLTRVASSDVGCFKYGKITKKISHKI